MKSYSKKERNAYFCGMLGQNMIYAVVSTGIAYYYQSVIFLPAAAIGVIFSVSRVFDIVKDPMMGTIIDRTQTKWGKCRPYLLFAPAIVCVFTILTFINTFYCTAEGTAEKSVILIWAAGSYLLWGLAYTLGDVALWTLPSLMTADEKERSRLMAAARIAASIGGGAVMFFMLPTAQKLGAKLGETLGDNDRGLQYGVILVTLALTFLAFGLFQLTGPLTHERVRQRTVCKTSFTDSIKLMWHCRPFRKLFLSGLLRSPVMVLNTVQMTLLAYYYGNNGRTSYLLVLLLLGGGSMAAQLTATAAAPKIIENTEKAALYRICCLVCAAPFLLIFLLYLAAPDKLDKPLYLSLLFVLVAVPSFGQGLLTVLQSVMTADAVDYHERYTGLRPDGVFFSGQTLLIKLSSGIAAIISGAVYAAAGFSGSAVKAVNDALSAGASFKSDPQFWKYRLAIFFLFCIPPALGNLLAVLPMRKYPPVEKMVDKERDGEYNNDIKL